MAFLQEYDALAKQGGDPATTAKAQGQLLQRWLALQPLELFAELRDHRPIFVSPGPIVVTKSADVQEVLDRDRYFTVRPYAPKMERIAGTFILGTEEGPRYQRDVSILRLAVRRDDLPSIRAFVAATADQLIDEVMPRRKIEVVSSLSRRVPLRLVGHYFGVPGPDEATLYRWAHTMFWDIFANLSDDPTIREAANVSGREIGSYLDELIAQRRAEIDAGTSQADDVLTRLLRMQCNPSTSFDNATIRSNLIGLLVGAIDTTSKAIIHVIDELLRRPEQLRAARQAALDDNDELFGQYVAEALRFKPQNIFLVRLCEQPYTVARGTPRATAVKPGTIMFVANASAMRDGAEVEAPEEFRIDRPHYEYVHFGHGLHTCFGQYISRVQIEEVVKRLLRAAEIRRAQGPHGEIQYEQIFPSSFTVEFVKKEQAASPHSG